MIESPVADCDGANRIDAPFRSGFAWAVFFCPMTEVESAGREGIVGKPTT